MPDPLLCTRCGSDSVTPRLRVIARGESNARYDLELELELEVQRQPNAMQTLLGIRERNDDHS